MRILVLGGTKFVGRAITEHLTDLGHQLMVVHRGESEPPDLTGVAHLHVDRLALPTKRAELEAYGPDVVIDVSAGSGADVQPALEALDAIPGEPRYIAISSGDVYRAYEGVHTGKQTDELPLTEDSPLRERHYVDGSENENLEIEPAYLERGGTVLRLGAVYGPYDYQRRFEFVLRRLRAGRKRIPIGAGTFLFSKVYAHDVATAVENVLPGELPDAAVRGQAFNLVERSTAPFRLFAEQILAATGELGAGTELVRVPDDALPDDLAITAALPQHLLLDGSLARDVLGWEETDYATALQSSVAWHLANPPEDASPDFSADDKALDAA